jgi:rhodanese-related sulfurtransferase
VKIGYRQLVSEAESQIVAIGVEEAIALVDDPDTVIVDVRDIRELQREGRIPGSLHAPRGMLEFWVDPESPYHREIFASGKRFVFYCSKGWRSALATRTVQDMGLAPVGHIAGGFEAWVAADGPVESKD